MENTLALVALWQWCQFSAGHQSFSPQLFVSTSSQTLGRLKTEIGQTLCQSGLQMKGLSYTHEVV